MREVKWANFKLSPMEYIKQEKTKVLRGDGSYFVVEYFSPYVEDSAVKVRESFRSKEIREHRCNLCRSVKRVVWVVPFDGSYAPGHYCYKCRKTRSILDIRTAKRNGKVY